MLTTLEEQATRANTAKKENQRHKAWIDNKVSSLFQILNINVEEMARCYTNEPLSLIHI